MDEQGIQEWWAKRVPFSGRLSDYAMLIGQNNRALQSNPKSFLGTTLFLGPNPNRISVCASAQIINSISADVVTFQILGLDLSTVVYEEEILLRQLNVGATDLVVQNYNPVRCNILDFGSLIQNAMRINCTVARLLFLIEVTMNPKCCNYIGGM